MGNHTYKIQDISEKYLNESVKISGWIHNKRDHGGVLFLDIRAFGEKVQAVVEKQEMIDIVSKIKLESVVNIAGVVRLRPKGSENLYLKSGKIEIVASEITVESEAIQIPFQINENEEINEDLRLQYRFLDLRTEQMRNNILLRSSVISYTRKRMEQESFVEFQTPILTASSPEGARDFLVPSRLNQGKFYALPQAPQQFKQLLMVSGFEKYFQIAPCFRDEDARADRSPGEFYQLDIEMSFVSQDDIFATMEPIMYDIFEKFAGNGKYISTRKNPDGTHAIWVNIKTIQSLKYGSTEFSQITQNLNNFYKSHNKKLKEAQGKTSSEIMSHAFGFPIKMRDYVPINVLTHENWDAGFIITCEDELSINAIKNHLLEVMFNDIDASKRTKISPYPFKRIPYEESMLKYGNDKPDLRNPIEIFDASKIFASSKFKVFVESISKGEVVRAIPVHRHGKSTEYFKTEMQNFAKQNGAEFGIAYMIFEDGTVKNCPIRNAYKIDKNKDEIYEKEFKILVEAIKSAGNLKDGDAVFFACGKKDFASKIAGLVRTKIGNDLNLIDKNSFEFCWIVDFPFYEWNEDEKKIEFSHNPFSMPQGGIDSLLLGQDVKILRQNLDKLSHNIQKQIAFDIMKLNLWDTLIDELIGANYSYSSVLDYANTGYTDQLEKVLAKFSINPLTIKAYQYDIVCNGIELSSGAIRNHKLDVMFKAFEIAGYTEEEVRTQFAGMVKAFSYGVPPHGGIAPGIDRMIMLLAGTDSIRDIIAFPLNGKGQDLLMNAPSEVSERQCAELGIFTERSLKEDSEKTKKRFEKLGLKISKNLD